MLFDIRVMYHIPPLFFSLSFAFAILAETLVVKRATMDPDKTTHDVKTAGAMHYRHTLNIHAKQPKAFLLFSPFQVRYFVSFKNL